MGKIGITKNGIKYFRLPPIVSGLSFFSLLTLTGSGKEPQDKIGLTHLLEHLLMESELEDNEVVVNASTSLEYLKFYGQCLDKDIEILLNSMAQKIKGLLLTQNRIDDEIKVLTEEYNRALSNPDKLIEIKSVQAIFNRTSFANYHKESPVKLNGIDKNELIRYFNSLFSSNNLIMVYSGPLAFNALKKNLEAYFGNLVKSETKLVEKCSQKPNPQKITGLKQVVRPVRLAINFLTYPANDPRVYAVDLINEYLTHGHTAKLFSVTRQKQQLSYSVRGNHAKYRFLGHYSIIATSSNPEQLIEVIKSELKMLGKNLNKTLVKNLKNKLIHRQKIFYLANPNNFFNFSAYNCGTKQQLETPDVYFKKILKISDKQIQDAIHILNPENMFIVRSD